MTIACILFSVAVMFLVLWTINEFLAYSVTGFLLFSILWSWVGFTLAVAIASLIGGWILYQLNLIG